MSLSGLPWSARIGLGFIAMLVFTALFPGVVAPYDPVEIGAGSPQVGPNWDNLFGTDQLGRDVFSRVVWGTRVAVFVALAAVGLALVVGSLFGAFASVTRGWSNTILLRALELMIAFPVTVLAVVLATAMRPGYRTTIIVLALIYTPAIARVVRGNILNQMAEDYVTAEQAFGASRYWILVRHVRLNMTAPVLVFATVIIAEAVLTEAALSFIGVGIPPPTASWGNVVSDGRNLVTSGGWWVSTFGGLAIFTSMLAINAFAEGMADTLAAPSRLAGNDAEDKNRSATRTSVTTDADEPYETLPVGLISAEAVRVGTAQNQPPLLEIEDLTIRFPEVHGDVEVVSGVSLVIREGENIGLVGESGSGKSLTALAIMGLLPTNAEVAGSIRFKGADLLTMDADRRRSLLGHEIAMIYQDALSALNPAMRIVTQLNQLCRRGSYYTPEELMTMVGLPEPSLLRAYPHELSGGQRQRVLIAMALSRDPSLLVADEPTTALDETVQAQVIELIEDIGRERGLALLLISHDLALVVAQAERIAVMYAGRIAETAPSVDLLTDPQHPYTNGLLSSILSLEVQAETLTQIRGTVPSPAEFTHACRFSDRCLNASELCDEQRPELVLNVGRRMACHHPVVRNRPPVDAA